MQDPDHPVNNYHKASLDFTQNMTNATNQNEGCLSAFLRLFGVRPQQTYTYAPPPSIESAESIIEIPEAITVESLPYRTRDDFLSTTELSFYRVLLSLVGNRAIICPKVGLAEVFFIVRPHENQSYRNRIVQKHLDFLLCDSKSMRPILGIELDDSSHARSDRQARDKFVDEVFEAANLPLIHVPAKYSYNTNELSTQLGHYLGGGISSPTVISPETTKESLSITTAVDAPLCPKCGVPMVVRTVARGEHQGKKFYGCQNYPRCREMLPFKAQTHD